jgi:hypothetical protein
VAAGIGGGRTAKGDEAAAVPVGPSRGCLPFADRRYRSGRGRAAGRCVRRGGGAAAGSPAGQGSSRGCLLRCARSRQHRLPETAGLDSHCRVDPGESPPRSRRTRPNRQPFIETHHWCRAARNPRFPPGTSSAEAAGDLPTAQSRPTDPARVTDTASTCGRSPVASGNLRPRSGCSRGCCRALRGHRLRVRRSRTSLPARHRRDAP